MSLNHAALAVLSAAGQAGHGEPAIHPYAVGGIALVVLLAMLAAVLMVGGGR